MMKTVLTIASQILGALKEGNRFNRRRLSRSLNHGCIRAVLVLFIDTEALNGEANGSVGTLATVLNTIQHNLPW